MSDSIVYVREWSDRNVSGTESGGLLELNVPVSVLELEPTMARACVPHSCDTNNIYINT